MFKVYNICCGVHYCVDVSVDVILKAACVCGVHYCVDVSVDVILKAACVCGVHYCVNVSVDVILKATGDAPIMKKKRWAIANTRTVGWVASFLKKFIKLPESDTLVSDTSSHEGVNY